MGCVGSIDQKPDIIIVRMRRLKHEINSKIEKTKNEAFAQQKQLISEFKKPKPFRAAAAQNALANSITMKINRIHTFQIVRSHIEKMLEYSVHLDKQDHAKESLYPSMRVILYSEPILKDQEISGFCTMIRKKFPDIKEALDSQVDSQIMRHHKKNELPTASMTNQYFLKLINQQSLSIQQINKAGHNIRFGI